MATEFETAFEQVRLALQERGFAYTIDADDKLTIDYGSARISAIVGAPGGTTTVRVEACVLDGLSDHPVDALLVLRAVNDRNRTTTYGKFWYDDDVGRILVEYELLGHGLTAVDLVNALTTIGQLADDHDDLLRDELGGGRRGIDRSLPPG